VIDTAEFLQELYKTVPRGFAEIRLIYEHRAENVFTTEHDAKQYEQQIKASGSPKRTLVERHEDKKTHTVTYSVDVAGEKKWRQLPIGDIQQRGLDMLHSLNTEWHIYHRTGISYQQRSTKPDIVMLPAIWLDVDDCSPDAYNQLLGMNFYPNLIVHSGGGFHAYWLLTEPVMADSKEKQFEIERTMEGMILGFGGKVDPKTKDVTRILRTPGFINIKTKYADKPLARVVFEDDARYTFEALHHLYAPMGKPKQAEITRYIPHEALDRTLPNRVKTYLQTGAANGSRNSDLYYCARAYNDAGYSQFDASNDLSPRARADGLRDNDIAKTIASAFKNSPNPSSALPAHMRTFIAVEDSTGGAK
jgi:hypothetical protein